MKKQQRREVVSSRRKLMAAVAMLLFACIMTVSSTFAWFTLSTAPEIKGISTTVGTNGNLEVALGNYKTVYGGEEPEIYIGASMDAGINNTIANETWGNLIDLTTEDDHYGLGKIRLYPSRLNVTEGGLLNAFSPLSFPVYGTDGRITGMNAGTMLGYFNENTDGFSAAPDPEKIDFAGVNAIGASSSVSERQFALNNAISAIVNNRIDAKNLTESIIRKYSGSLAAIVFENYGSVTGANVITFEDAKVLEDMVLELGNVVDHIESSAENMIYAVLAANENLKSEDAWVTVLVGVKGQDGLANKIKFLKEQGGIPVNTELPLLEGSDGIIADIDAMRQKLSDASSTLTAAKSDGTIAWSEIKEAVSQLLSVQKVKICNQFAAAILDTKGSDDPNSAYQKVQNEIMNGKLSFQFAPESGIFSDISEMVGTIHSKINFGEEGLSFEEITIMGEKPLTVETGYTEHVDGKLGRMYALVKLLELSAPNSNVGTVTAINDTYGYTVDLLFQTNAADSYLQLQTVGANRIYAGGSASTMGAGSNMTFSLGTLSKAQIDRLAIGIRVVFYETPDENTAAEAPSKILGVAALDTQNGVLTGSEYKLDLRLVEFSTDGEKLTVNPVKPLENDPATAFDESIVLAPLSANSIKRISALVFLDSEFVDNQAALESESLNGKLNLQFSSSANLVPMKNADLMDGRI